jgi:DNA-binding response OmpR family regulator
MFHWRDPGQPGHRPICDAETGGVIPSIRLNMRILLVEDDPDLSQQLKGPWPTPAMRTVDHAPDRGGGRFLGETEYDAVIPGPRPAQGGGVSVLERWRRDTASA